MEMRNDMSAARCLWAAMICCGGAGRCACADRVASWLVSGGIDALVIAGSVGAVEGARTVAELRANGAGLSGRSLRGYLSPRPGRAGLLSLAESEMDDGTIESIESAYDIALVALEASPDSRGAAGWLESALARVPGIPAMLCVHADGPAPINLAGSAVKRLLDSPGAVSPAGFCMAPFDREVAARLAGRWGIQSWGDGLDAASLAGRLMDRAIPRRASVRDVANHAERGVREIARPEGVEEILAGIRRDPEFEKIVGDANRRGDRDELRRAVAAVALRAAEALKSRGAPGARADEAASCAVDEILGFGPLEYLLKDDGVTEIMVSGPGLIFFEKEGRLARAGLSFADSSQLLSVIERMLAPTGRRVDEASPMVDARLPDGSRLHAVIGPVAIDGPALTVRRFGRASWDLRELVRRGSMTSDAARFLSECVASRVSMVVSGGTGTGKTTMLAALASEIADGERIVTIEDAAELRIRTTHVVRLEARPPNVEGAGAISIRDLVRNALRMRPDRIVVGECRGAEAVDMLQAMNTGHEGSLTTVHANSPRDAVSRLETMALMAGLDLPICAVREQIARAIGVIVQLARVGAQRKVVEISEITGMEGQVISMQTLAAFDQRSGMLISTGLAPAHRCGADGTGHSHGIRGIA